MKTLSISIIITLVSITTSANSTLRRQAARSGILINHSKFGEFNFYSGGKRGLILCFHGAGGRARAWATKKEKSNFLMNLKKEGFSYLCPTSKNRKSKKWDPINNFKNRDVLNVDSLLKFLGEQRNKLFLVGHSNGGGFSSRYSLISRYAKNIKAIQYSNSTGIKPYLQHRSYKFPTRFVYASCDGITTSSRVDQNANILLRKMGPHKVQRQSLDFRYRLRGSNTCHEFLNTSAQTSSFFLKWVRPSRSAGSRR